MHIYVPPSVELTQTSRFHSNFGLELEKYFPGMSLHGSIDGKKAELEESMSSGEFFLSQMRSKIDTLTKKRDSLKTSLAAIDGEERSLLVKQSKLNGILISQDMRIKQELDVARSGYRMAEDLLYASQIEKEEKCKKLENDIRNLQQRLRPPS
jgi:hypothetical protein